MVNIEQSITLKYPNIQSWPNFISQALFKFFKHILHEQDINEFLSRYSNYEGVEFVEAILEYFNFSYSLSNKERENIPALGRVVIIANHPLGALDALALIKLVSEVRRDVKIVANDMLSQIEQLKSIILPIDNMTSRYSKESIKSVYNSLEREEAVIIFPAGEVSRARPTGVKDVKWKKGFLKFAKNSNSPILPIYINGKNSNLFYGVSFLNKNFSTILLVREMFNKKSQNINFKVGELIPNESLNLKTLSANTSVNLLKKHLYRLNKSKSGIFITQKSIAHPENRQIIKQDLKSAILLGETFDSKKIYLYDNSTNSQNSALMKEIGRLREFSFRKVGEGSGKRRDLDSYDIYYKHIILWDDENLEVVGAYRIGESNFIYNSFDNEGFYTNTLFEFESEFEGYLTNSIELGRSFIQPKYWNSKALDYLWQGIGAYLKSYPNIKYMFGGVSISDNYPKLAKDMIVYLYRKHFSHTERLVRARREYKIENTQIEQFRELFSSKEYRDDLKILKEQLKYLNSTVPTLYKQYSELCEDGGVKFLDFGVDKNFQDCVDGFIIVDIDKIKPQKRRRYIR